MPSQLELFPARACAGRILTADFKEHSFFSHGFPEIFYVISFFSGGGRSRVNNLAFLLPAVYAVDQWLERWRVRRLEL
jgi:hypothetical protein